MNFNGWINKKKRGLKQNLKWENIWEGGGRRLCTEIEHWAMPHRMMHELQIKSYDLRLAHWVFMMLGNLLDRDECKSRKRTNKFIYGMLFQLCWPVFFLSFLFYLFNLRMNVTIANELVFMSLNKRVQQFLWQFIWL